MVSRRIEAAQKKVEERNFDSRKNLLEYDEVMDHQRKRGLRLPPGDPRRGQLQDPHPGHARRADRPGRGALPGRRLRRRPASPSSPPTGWAWSSTPPTSAAATSPRPRRRPATRPAGMIQTQIQEVMEENLGAEDATEWNWQALANQVNTRWGLKTTDRAAQADRQGQPGRVPERAGREGASPTIDLSDGQAVPGTDWGLRSIVRLGPAQVPDQADAGGAGGQGASEDQGTAARAGAGAVPAEGDRVPGAGGHGPVHGGSSGAGSAAASATTARGCTTGPRQRFAGVARRA